MKCTAWATAVVLGLTLPIVAQSAVYRWVDAAGTIHFASTPPPQGHYAKIDPRVSPATAAPGVAGITELSKQYAGAAAERHKAREARLATEAQRAARCAKARQQVSALQDATAHRLFVVGPNGQRARMTQPAFDKRLDTAQAAATANCPS